MAVCELLRDRVEGVMIRISHVLCPIDFSSFSARALQHAAALARWYGARLTAIHVWHEIPPVNIIPSLQALAPSISMPEPDRAGIEEDMHRYCAEIVPGIDVTCRLVQSPNVHAEIVAQVETLGADLLVVGSHGRSGFERMLLGSVTERVVRKAPCPVLVVPTHEESAPGEVHFKQIVCAVDFSEASLSAVAYALSLAEESDASLQLLHVLEIPPEFQAMSSRGEIDIYQVRAEAEAEVLRRLRALVPDAVRSFCHVESAVAEGKAHREILKSALEHSAGLIVMGVSGHGPIDRWVFGSTTAGVMRGAHCPVLIVRTPALTA
jgi:nucleotide-binding universal stress UspA family protein